SAAAVMRDGTMPGGPGRLSNIVFMGMGEPLANYKRVVAAVRRITDPAPGGLGIGQRSVTVSTVGLAPAIRKLADEKMQVRLAVSLHTPDDELRDTLVPVNNRWSVDEVLSAARYYADVSGRRVSIEYALIRDINNQPWWAEFSFMYVVMRAYGVEYNAWRWHEFHGGPRALSAADLNKLLGP